jgi:outer membrane lipoprotein carrier protein
MKKLFLVITILFVGVVGNSQTQDEVIQMLNQTANSIQCMNCRFTQQRIMTILTEPSVSEGIMSYNSPDHMRWEYTSPYSLAIVSDGDKVTKITDGIEEVLDKKSRKIYKGIENIIMGSASGKNLFDKTVFDISIKDSGKFWVADLKPKQHNMKRMFYMLTIYCRKDNNTINKVEITEGCGDITTIQFFDIKINDLCD